MTFDRPCLCGQGTDKEEGMSIGSRKGEDRSYIHQAQGQLYVPQKDNRIKCRILLAAVCAVFFLFAGVGVVMAYLRNRPAYRLRVAVENLAGELAESVNPLTEKIGIEDLTRMMAEEGGHVSTCINFTADRLFGYTIGVDTEYYKDMQKKELRADTSLSMMNYEFAHLNIYADEEAVCFSVPELFLENMYVDNEDVVSQYNGSFLAEVAGRSNLEDFSLDFFPEADQRYVLRDWKNVRARTERFTGDLAACEDAMVMERAGKGVYRVVLPARETDRLLRDAMDSCESAYATSEAGQWWKEYDRLLVSDVSMLVAINRRDCIESITFEEPVRMLDGKAAISGSLHFLGSAKSTDKVQGEITVEAEDGAARSLYLQTIHSGTDDSCGLEVELELMEDEDTLLRAKYVADSDALRNTFEVGFSLWNDEEDLEFTMEGGLDDIVKGRSLELEVESMQFYMDGEEIFKITGDILLEPLEEEIKSTVKKETAFFEMTESDWLSVLYKIGDAYGGLLGSLW